MRQIIRLEYQFLQLYWQKQDPPVEGFNMSYDAASALVIEQFVSHVQTVDFRTKCNGILIHARILASDCNVVAAQMNAENKTSNTARLLDPLTQHLPLL